GLLFTQLNLRSFFSARTYILFTQRPQRFFFFFACSAFSLRALRELIFFHAKGANFLSRKGRKGYFLLLCVLCVFSSCSARTYFFHAKGAKVYFTQRAQSVFFLCELCVFLCVLCENLFFSRKGRKDFFQQ